MTDPTPPKPSDLWPRVWPLVLILIVTTVAWFLLSNLALHARVTGPAQTTKGPNVEDYALAKTWATDLLGLASTLAGFLGVAAATKKTADFTAQGRADSAQRAEGGMIGILAGATLLGVGSWLAPLGLAAMATGVAADRVARTRNERR